MATSNSELGSVQTLCTSEETVDSHDKDKDGAGILTLSNDILNTEACIGTTHTSIFIFMANNSTCESTISS
jgi:hypothetical protein